MQERKEYVGYEYKEITVPAEYVSMYLDCYEKFGWETGQERHEDAGQSAAAGHLYVTVHMKRDRKIINKAELTRLQRNFEACTHEIERLQKMKARVPSIGSLTAGLVGTVCMACSVFAVMQEPPVVWLCVLLAVPGLIGWILPYFLYRSLSERQSEKLDPLIEEKLEEIYKICEKGHSLL
ncbi:MAG: hypothetical protein ACI4F3_12630 [Enterocloster sp.]